MCKGALCKSCIICYIVIIVNQPVIMWLLLLDKQAGFNQEISQLIWLQYTFVALDGDYK